MNSMELKDRIRNISKERNVDFNTLLRLYMYDRFIERLAASKYKNNYNYAKNVEYDEIMKCINEIFKVYLEL